MADEKHDLGTGFGRMVYSPIERDAAGNAYLPGAAPIIERIPAAPPGDVQAIAASQIALLINYYGTVLEQARQSFRWALIAAGVGFVFLLAAVAFLLSRVSLEVGVVNAVAGVVVEG